MHVKREPNHELFQAQIAPDCKYVKPKSGRNRYTYRHACNVGSDKQLAHGDDKRDLCDANNARRRVRLQISRRTMRFGQQ